MTSSRYNTDEKYLQAIEMKTPIAWGKMDDDNWSILDDIVYSKLSSSNSLFHRVQLLEETIYSEASKLFGHCQAKKQRIIHGKSRRTKQCIMLVKEKNKLLLKINLTVNPIEKAALQDLLTPIREKIKNYRRSEKHRKKRWLFKNAQKSFRNNPYDAGKNLLDPRSNISLSVSQFLLDEHKSDTVKDIHYAEKLTSLEGLPPKPFLISPFCTKSLDEGLFVQIVNSRRNKSAPGLNKIPYKVYKKCSKIRSFLFNIFKSCLKHSVVPLQWRYAMEHYIPKTKPPNPGLISDFRPIALTNVEGKLFFSLISKRLEQHIITNNKFINTTIQKGCMEKVPGCWEHISMVWSALKEARQNKSTIANIWLDIANAYGSIPHRLIFFALERYGIDSKWISIIKNYYSGLYTKSFSDSAPSSWHQHYRGIFAGCTLSIILFLSGINVVIEYVLTSKAPQVIHSNNVSLPVIRAFMDDLNLMSTSISASQDLLSKCIKALSWAGMKFRADKSRSIIILHGRSINSAPFKVSEPLSPTDFSCYIPSIHSSPVKFLGRLIDGSLSDRKAIDELEGKLVSSLNTIHKSYFSGTQKLWFLHHLLLPRIQWSLLIYEVSTSFALLLEKRISVFIRKWLKLHPSITNLSLYSKISPCPLPMKPLTTILKSSKISGHLLLRDSNDSNVSSANPSLKSGNWKVDSTVSIAEAEMEFQQIRGPTQMGRNGLGIAKLEPIPDKGAYEYRKLVSSIAKSIDEEQHTQRALQLNLQCNWMTWENYTKNDLSWSNILAMPPNLLSFCISSTYNVLPSPSNLKRWKLSDDSSCTLCCKSICTVSHILGACPFSLRQGRFTFRHDSVLEYLASTLKSFTKQIGTKKSIKINKINFIKSGQKPPANKYQPLGILHLASDWILLADFDKELIFPPQIALTQLRPDIVIFSKSLKRVVIVELTCPCEENMNTWHMTKISKYSSLLEIIRTNDWKPDFFAVEVGARGYPSATLSRCLKRLGFPKMLLRNTIKNSGKIAMESSFCIWLARDSKQWTNPKVIFKSNTRCNMPETSKDLKRNIKDISKKYQRQSKVQKTFKKTLDNIEYKHVGFINKGNTCYANAILQALSTIPSFCCQESSESGCFSPLARALSLNLSLLKKRSMPIDPSNFLLALQNIISNNRGTNFDINTQQDVPEILQLVVDELKGISIIAENIISSSLSCTTTCTSCFSETKEENNYDIIPLPLCNSVSASLQLFLTAENLIGENRWFCNMCNSLQESLRVTEFSKCGSILIIHLLRFVNFDGKLIKDNRKVSLIKDNLIIPVKVDEGVTINKKFKLKATINHSGTLNAGHYWAYIYSEMGNSWLKCNDSSVFKVPFSDLNNDSSYILVYSSS